MKIRVALLLLILLAAYAIPVFANPEWSPEPSQSRIEEFP
jgi:hypothetical protein